MKTSLSLAILAVAPFVLGAPAPNAAVKRQAINDAAILNYALTLEHLEDKFYREGLANYSQQDFVNAGFNNPFFADLKEISYDETTHVAFLTGALQAAGYPAVAECTYNFPTSDIKSFVKLASILEGVGVSAYLGAAASIANKAYLTAAGSILTVEARHTAYLRSKLLESPFPQPFDTPLDFDEVYTLAAAFIVSCPSSNPPLPVKAFPSITVVTGGGNTYTGATVTLLFKNTWGSGPIYAAFPTVTGPIFAATTPVAGGVQVTIPAGVYGQTYVVLTTSNTMLTDDNTLAGPGIIEISLTAAFH